MHPGSPIKDSVQVYYQFRNEEKAGLGLPMPAGVLRVYQQDSKGGVQFVGEDRIMHTPKDETLNVKIGNAFDVICERKQTDFTKIATNVYEFEYEITLRNHKASAISVEVNEPVGGTWRMITSSHQWTKTSAWAAQFKVPVAADGTAVLKYRVRYVLRYSRRPESETPEPELASGVSVRVMRVPGKPGLTFVLTLAAYLNSICPIRRVAWPRFLVTRGNGPVDHACPPPVPHLLRPSESSVKRKK